MPRVKLSEEERKERKRERDRERYHRKRTNQLQQDDVSQEEAIPQIEDQIVSIEEVPEETPKYVPEKKKTKFQKLQKPAEESDQEDDAIESYISHIIDKRMKATAPKTKQTNWMMFAPLALPLIKGVIDVGMKYMTQPVAKTIEASKPVIEEVKKNLETPVESSSSSSKPIDPYGLFA